MQINQKLGQNRQAAKSQDNNLNPEGHFFQCLKIISPPGFLILTKPLYLAVFTLAIVSQLAVAQLRLIIELELRTEDKDILRCKVH